jgi:hypothetical protein
MDKTFLGGIVKCPEAVTPAKAGVYDPIEITGSPPARGDEKNTSSIYYEFIIPWDIQYPGSFTVEVHHF